MAREIAVAVPVRDEQRRLPALLVAIQTQAGLRLDTVSLCLLFDGCEDGGFDIIGSTARQYSFNIVCELVPRSFPPNAGRARRRAMDLAFRTLREPAESVFLTTDADTVPDPDWCANSRASLETTDIVAGRIHRENRLLDDARSQLEACLERIHRLRRSIDPLPWEDQSATHGSVGGASLGFTAECYRELGGFSELAAGEDGDIVARARRAGFRVRQDPCVNVTTSSRLNGRALGGLACELRRSAENQRTCFTDPVPALAYYRLQAAARRGFEIAASDDAELIELAEALALPRSRVLREARLAPNAEAFVHRVLPDDCEFPQLPLASVEMRLGALERAYASSTADA